MLKPVQSALRAAIEGGVELVAAYNRRRLPRTGNPFLVGIHEPMRSELTLRDLPVTGSIPAGLNGRYLKIGANPVSPDPAGVRPKAKFERGRGTCYRYATSAGFCRADVRGSLLPVAPSLRQPNK